MNLLIKSVFLSSKIIKINILHKIGVFSIFSSNKLYVQSNEYKACLTLEVTRRGGLSRQRRD